MTGGIAFEGLNHAGTEDTNILIILNDNCMSIDPACWALKEYLTDISLPQKHTIRQKQNMEDTRKNK